MKFLPLSIIVSAVLAAITLCAGMMVFHSHASTAQKNSAVQGCIEVAQSYKNTTGKADAGTAELHEVSFNQDMYSFCIHQKGL